MVSPGNLTGRDAESDGAGAAADCAIGDHFVGIKKVAVAIPVDPSNQPAHADDLHAACAATHAIHPSGGIENHTILVIAAKNIISIRLQAGGSVDIGIRCGAEVNRAAAIRNDVPRTILG